MSAALDNARHEERELRARLADVVAAQRSATQEAARLSARGALDGAGPQVQAAAREQSERAQRLATEVDNLRALVRTQEGVVARLEADIDNRAEPGAR
jgi:hypothetical protein